jgi:hypothetical protein
MRERTGASAARFPASVYRFHSGDEIAALLRAAGFDRVDVRGAGSGPDLLIVVASV